MHVDGAVKRLQFTATHGFHDLVSRQHTARTLSQRDQQVELVGSQIRRLLTHSYGACIAVYFQRAKTHDCGRWRGAIATLAAQNGPDTGQQFAWFKGFGKIVVGTQLQTNDAVHGVALGSQHQHRNLCSGTCHGSNATADFQPVHIGQHQVQDDQIRRLGAAAICGLQLVQATLSVGLVGHFESVVAQVVAHHLGEADIVLDHQKLVRAHRGQCSHARALYFVQGVMLEHARIEGLSAA